MTQMTLMENPRLKLKLSQHFLIYLLMTMDWLLESQEVRVPRFTPEELIGLTFLHEREWENGDRVRAQVVNKIIDHDAHNHQNINNAH